METSFVYNNDILLNISFYLLYYDLYNLCSVNKSLYGIDDEFWKNKYIHDYGNDNIVDWKIAHIDKSKALLKKTKGLIEDLSVSNEFVSGKLIIVTKDYLTSIKRVDDKIIQFVLKHQVNTLTFEIIASIDVYWMLFDICNQNMMVIDSLRLDMTKEKLTNYIFNLLRKNVYIEIEFL